MQFSGKNVLVTGGSRGIGAEIAKVLAGYGLKVWINYRSSAAQADELQAEIEKAGGQAAVIGFDVSDEAAYIDAIKTIIQIRDRFNIKHQYIHGHHFESKTPVDR